ncbi:MAG: hypothetical protein ACM3UL_04085 [Ignavibacteria bacterium]
MVTSLLSNNYFADTLHYLAYLSPTIYAGEIMNTAYVYLHLAKYVNPRLGCIIDVCGFILLIAANQTRWRVVL